MAQPSQTPQRAPSGLTTDGPFGPLANHGLPNPFFYHVLEDDFDEALAQNGFWAIYNKSTGSAALAAGDGGRVLFTTAATSGDVEALQTTIADFTFTAGKKSFFLTRLQMSNITATGPTIIAGLTQKNAAFSVAAITDGLYFSINNGIAALIHAVGSVLTTIALPTTAYATQANPSAVAIAAATDYDMGFYIDRSQNIYAFFGQQLVGRIPQSGSGAVNPVTGTSINPQVGPVASLQQSITPLVLTAVNLCPTLAISEGAGAAVVTMNADFLLSSKER